ncbi:MAG TPA: glycosyltransferase family 39 protein, partial [Caldimonas sp.]
MSFPESKYLLWGLALLIGCVWFLSLGTRHLLPSDEGRYAEIAREMFASGDWVTIRYNDLKYFEKPPLHLWMTALAFEAFGVGDWQARLWAGISGVVGLVVTVIATRLWFGDRVALLTGLVLLATPAWIIAGHFNSLDIGVAGALACVLAGLLMAQHPLASPAQRRQRMWLTWSAVAVAVLTKGLIGLVLPGLAVIVYAFAARDHDIWRRLHIASGVPLMLALVAPWFVAASLRNPEFPQFFFIHEHWQRYTSNVHQRSGAWWYFVPQLIMGFLPWLGLAPGMVKVVAAEGRAAGFRPVLFASIWVATIFLFFSASGSKLPGYIIPLYPALAILGGLALNRLERSSWRWHIVAMAVVTIAGVVASPFVARLGADVALRVSFRAFAPWLAVACMLGTLGLAVAWILNRRDTTLSIVAYALSCFALVMVTLTGHESFGRDSSQVALVAPLEAILRPGMPVYSVRLLDHTLPFYLRRTMVMVESPGELDFGTQQEPAKWLPTLAAFVDRWRSPQMAAAIMTHETFDELRRQGVVMIP